MTTWGMHVSGAVFPYWPGFGGGIAAYPLLLYLDAEPACAYCSTHPERASIKSWRAFLAAHMGQDHEKWGKSAVEIYSHPEPTAAVLTLNGFFESKAPVQVFGKRTFPPTTLIASRANRERPVRPKGLNRSRGRGLRFSAGE